MTRHALLTTSISILAVSSLLQQTRSVCAGDRDGAAGVKGKKIQSLVERSGRSIGFSGAVLVAEQGKVLAACAAGYADPDNKTPLTSTTLFELASATKPFTAIAICQLVEEGKLGLDDSIADHLPGIFDSCQAITVRHLLQHTSGIPGTNSNGRGEELAAVIPLFLKGGPQSEPGSKWEYWNQGYSLLSEIIATASGTPYTDYCQTKVFKPAKMESTCFTGDDSPDHITVAIGESTKGPSRSALEHPYGSYGFQYRGMGGIVTNVWDLWRWDRALATQRILGVDLQKEMFKPGLGGYGLGWYVGTDSHGISFQRHSGGVRGFECEVRRFPDTNSCLFVLCNRDDVRLSILVTAIEQILFDRTLSPGIPASLTENQQDPLLGTFVNQRNQTLKVEAIGTVTKGSIDWGGPVTQGFIGTNDQRQIIFCDGSTNTVLKTKRKDKKVASIQLLSSVFSRQE